MTEEWKTVDELLEELERVKYASAEYMGKTIKFAWKEVPDTVNLDVKFEKTFSDMTENEKSDANFKLMEAETFARIQAAGPQPDCFQGNVITLEVWAKIPKRLKALLISDMFNLMKALEKRF